MMGRLLFTFIFLLPTGLWALDWDEFSHTVMIKIQQHTASSICSGILMTENVVLTVAHCLIDAQSLEVGLGPNEFVSGQTFVIHSNYRGNFLDNNTDLALIFLEQPLIFLWRPIAFASVDPNLLFERIGFGQRDGRNIRTWMTSTFSRQSNQLLELNDSLGVIGDSGGPVFQRQNQQLVLVGIHTGRKIDPQGRLLGTSYTQLLSPELQQWINNNIQ